MQLGFGLRLILCQQLRFWIESFFAGLRRMHQRMRQVKKERFILMLVNELNGTICDIVTGIAFQASENL